MATKFFALACIRNNNGERRRDRSRPTHTKGVAPHETTKAEVSEAKAVFSVKSLSGIREAGVDVPNNRAQVMFCPSSVVNEGKISKTIEEAGFGAKPIKQEANDKSRQVCGISIKVIQSIAETLKHFLGSKT